MSGGDILGYKVKWVEDNLGVTRKALRVFEEKGLMPPNEGGGYRDYTNEDIDRIWTIRLLQGMGFSLNEIVTMANDESFDFDSALEEKVKQLEAERQKVDKHLGYAQTIKLTGRFPSRSKDMGTVTFNEFYEKSLDGWNVNSDPQAKQYQEIADMLLNTPEEELKDTDLGRLIDFLQNLQDMINNPELLIIESVLPKEIIKRMSLGASHPEVQLLVKMIYENRIANFPELKDMTLNQFVRFETSSYKSGDVARIKERDYGKDGCSFIADAIAIFGGYNSYSEVED